MSQSPQGLEVVRATSLTLAALVSRRLPRTPVSTHPSQPRGCFASQQTDNLFWIVSSKPGSESKRKTHGQTKAPPEASVEVVNIVILEFLGRFSPLPALLPQNAPRYPKMPRDISRWPDVPHDAPRCSEMLRDTSRYPVTLRYFKMLRDTPRCP